MKNFPQFFVLTLAILLAGAGCPLIKSKTTTTLPAAPSIRMDQGNPNESAGQGTVGTPGPGVAIPITFGSTTLSRVSEKKSKEPINLAAGLPYSLEMAILEQEWRSPSTTVSVGVPQMIYSAKPAKAAAFNDLINKKTKQITDEFLQQVADWEDDNVPLAEQINFIEVSVNARTANPKLLSLVFNISSFYSGSAHPNHYSRSFNYDLEQDKELQLADLFVPKKVFLPKLSAAAIAAVKSAPNDHGEVLERDLQWLSGGAGPDENNFHTITLSPEGFYIEFDPYDIDSYAAGPTEIVIPYAQLSGYVSPRVFVLVK